MGLAHCAHRSACRGKLGLDRCHGKIEIDFHAKVFGSLRLNSKQMYINTCILLRVLKLLLL